MKHSLLVLALLVPGTALGQRRHHHRRHHRERATTHEEAAAPAPSGTPLSSAPPPATELRAPSSAPEAATSPPPPTLAAVASPVVQTPTVAQAAPPAPLANPFLQPRAHRFAVELGPVFGLGISTSGLGVGPELGMEVGARLSLGPGALAFSLRGTWSAYERSGTLAMPCSPPGSGGSNANPAPGAPCVAQPAQGSYDYTLTEMLIRISIPLSYRVLPITSAFNAYLGVAPSLTVQHAETTAFTQRTAENALRFGVTGFAGAQYRLGFGALFVEVGYAWSPTSHRATGEVPLGSVQLALGYRLSIPSL